MAEESDYSYSSSEEGLSSSSAGEDEHAQLHGLVDSEEDNEYDERDEEDDDDGTRLHNYDIATFLDQAEDIPTALASLQGTSSNVIENMKLGHMLGKTGASEIQQPSRKTRSTALKSTENPPNKEYLLLSEEDEEYEEDMWDDTQAELMGLAPASSARAEKRRMASKQKRMSSGKLVRDRSGMPEVAKEMLGQGNLKYVSGDYAAAEKLFMDCIRLAPRFPDAYSSLSRLFEERGDMKKSMNFLMVAAYFSKKDAQIWKDAAIKSKEQGALRQAVHCFNQVIRREKNDLEWRYARGMTFLELNMGKKALEDLLYYQERHPDNPDIIKTITRLMYQMDRLDDAQDAIKTYMAEYPESTDLTHINLLAELYMNHAIQDWHGLLELMDQTRNAYVEDPNSMPTELESKEAIAYAHLGKKEKALEISEKLLHKPVEIFPDVFLLIASEYESLGMFDAAIPFFEKLACQAESNMDIWQRYAAVRAQQKGEHDGILKAWEKIVNTVTKENPHYIDAVMELSCKLLECGKEEEAKSCVNMLENVDLLPRSVLTIPENVYLQRAHVLRSCQRDDFYAQMFLEPVIKSLKLIIYSTETSSRKKGRKPKSDAQLGLGDDLFVWQSSQEKRRKKGHAEHITGSENKGAQAPLSTFDDIKSDIPVLSNPIKEKKNFEVVLYLVNVLFKMGKIHDAFDVCDLTVNVLAKKHPNKERRDTMKLYLADCCCRLGDFSNALRNIKGPAEQWPHSAHVWNIFTKITLGVGGLRQTSKYIMGMRKRFPESLPLSLLSGHIYMQNHQYGHAMGEYMHAYRLDQSEPVVKLCISNLFANYACATKSDRDLALTHAFAWMQEYGRTAQNPIEASYNAGRIAHQCSLLHLAVPLYKEALWHHDQQSLDNMEKLELDDGTISNFATSMKSSKQSESTRDLSREAAFNLALLFRESGALELARDVMRRYLVF